MIWGIATLHVETPMLDVDAQTSTTSYVAHALDDLRAQLDAEAQLHRMAGWRVQHDGGPVVVVAKVRDDGTLVTRVIYAVTWPAESDGDPTVEPTPVLMDGDLP